MSSRSSARCPRRGWGSERIRRIQVTLLARVLGRLPRRDGRVRDWCWHRMAGAAVSLSDDWISGFRAGMVVMFLIRVVVDVVLP